MPEFNLALTISAFIAGVLTFFAPCTLPLVPAFLGIISGANIDDFKDPEKLKKARWWIFKNALFYVLGFSLVFIIFGAIFSYAGQLFLLREWLPRIGGVLVIMFGSLLLGVSKFNWLNSEFKIPVPHLLSRVSLFNSFALGAVFAVGWSPCVGPLLGSILLLASSSGTVAEGIFLLMIFSIGLGLPFLITAILIGRAYSAFGRWGRILEILNKIAGVFLIALGIVLIFDWFRYFNIWLTNYFYRFELFEVFINKFL